MYNYNQGSMLDPQYQAAYKRAERRVRAKLGFYSHLASYVLVNGLLIVIYLLTGPIAGNYNYPWFVWPMFGWGIGLMFHFLGVFIFSNNNSEETRRQLIEEEMRRMGAYPPPPGIGPNPGYPYSNPNLTSAPFEVPPDKS